MSRARLVQNLLVSTRIDCCLQRERRSRRSLSFGPAGLIVVLEARPRFLERHLRFPADIDRQVVLVWHAVPAPHRRGLLDLAEDRPQGLRGNPDANYYLA